MISDVLMKLKTIYIVYLIKLILVLSHFPEEQMFNLKGKLFFAGLVLSLASLFLYLYSVPIMILTALAPN